MIETSSGHIAEIEIALGQLGLTLRRTTLISTLKRRKGQRCAFRVETREGPVVKARQFDTSEDARRIVELRSGLELAFTAVLAHQDRMLIEEWIDGVALSAVDAEARVEEAGALLGRLHARPLAPDVPATLSTNDRRVRALSDLALLSNAGLLVPHEATALRTEIARRDPGEACAALIHMDFCAENMLIDTRGRLRVIDNERLSIAAAGLDLGRTFDRWPMSEAAWTRFRRGYRSSAPAEPEAIGFWKIVAALLGARVRFTHSPERLDAVLARLRRFAAGDDLC